jgi:putative transposase
MNAPLTLPLPRDWKRHVKHALAVAVGLERLALLEVRSGFEHSPDPRAQLVAQLDATREHSALLVELCRLLRARLERVPAARRPPYEPCERLAILTLRSRAGWSTARAARELLVTPKTVASWTARLDEQGPDALVAPRRPVNAFDDAAVELVHHLHDTAPGLGRRKKAEVLLRAGLHLAASTVRRMLERPRPKRPTSPPPEPESPGPGDENERTAAPAPRVVKAKRPHHVWHVDLTTIPIGPPGRDYWAPWWPFSIVLCWLLSWHIVLVLDHFTRALLTFQLVRREPSASDVCATLDDAVLRAGTAPSHLISDQGSQFQSEYRAWCKRHGAKPRYGAVGQHGSIAIVERFILSLKQEFLRRIHVPSSESRMLGAMAAYQRWYNEHRPHASLEGRTPREMLASAPPPRERARIEPRARYPIDRGPPARRARGPLVLVVDHVGGFRELPVVGLREAA